MAEGKSTRPLPKRAAELEILSCDVDWLTCTVSKPARLPFAYQSVKRWQAVRSADGYPIRPYGANGYVGDYVDGITWGERQDGAMLRLSGEMAAKYAVQALLWAENVSRIDYQVTVRDSVWHRDWAENFLLLASKDERVQSGVTKWEEIHSSSMGSTAYLGRRSSSRLYRVYNKTAESQGLWPETSWRFEVEYKPPRAERHATRMRNQTWTRHDTLETIRSAFADYGFPIPVGGFPRHFKDGAPREPTTDERRLAYLKNIIKPMIRKMQETFDEGRILDALGFFEEGTGEVAWQECNPAPSLKSDQISPPL